MASVLQAVPARMLQTTFTYFLQLLFWRMLKAQAHKLLAERSPQALQVFLLHLSMG